ncbi:hypothetical protein Hanom_Chr14g01312421 [Helianthus anomalus]
MMFSKHNPKINYHLLKDPKSAVEHGYHHVTHKDLIFSQQNQNPHQSKIGPKRN